MYNPLKATFSASCKVPLPGFERDLSSNVTPAASTQRVVHPDVVDRLPAVELLALGFGYRREPCAAVTANGSPVLGGHAHEGIGKPGQGRPFQEQAHEPAAHTTPPLVRAYDDAGELDFLFGFVDPDLAVADRLLPVANDVGSDVGIGMPAAEHGYVDGPSGIAARPPSHLIERAGPARDLPRVGCTKLAKRLGERHALPAHGPFGDTFQVGQLAPGYLDHVVDGDDVALCIAASSNLHSSPLQGTRRQGQPQGDADQVGILELGTKALAPIIVEHLDAAGSQLHVKPIGLLPLLGRDEVHVIRRDGDGPDETVFVAVLLGDAGQEPPDPYPVRPHHHGLAFPIAVQKTRSKSLAVARTQLEDVSDLEAPLCAHRYAAIGAGRAVLSRGQVGYHICFEVPAVVDVHIVKALFVGAGDQVR